MRAVVFLVATASLFAQGVPRLTNARLEVRAFSGDLASQLRSPTAAWFGYEIKTPPRGESCCWSDEGRGCWLEGNRDGRMAGNRADGPIHLEGSNAAAVLFRIDNSGIEKVQVLSLSCPLDGGGLPFVWLTGVSASASLAELSRIALANTTDQLTDGAVFAAAQHDDPEADMTLKRLTAATEPERLRKKVAFWLGSGNRLSGVKTLEQMLKDDPSERVRDKVVFALSLSKQAEAMETLIAAAKTDSSPHVRGQAIFWLAQKAGKQAAATIMNAIQNDPDTEVKKKAVFALSQLPKEEGVPKLIEVARTQRNPDVRKQAFFWLGQSGDPRALDFLEKVLMQ